MTTTDLATRRAHVQNPSTANRMLAVATLGFAVNFWAWALLSPLGPGFKLALHLTSFQQALLVAVPVIVGSLGRIPVGALTDRLGGRIMFPLVSFATIIPVVFLGFPGHSSLTGLLVGGFFLGIAGTAFAVGVPFVSAWFPPERRGFAVGVFGAGMGGTAISALTTVRLTNAGSTATPFLITAGVLAAYGVLATLTLRDAPGRVIQTRSLGSRLVATARLRITWQAATLYAVGFGGYVAFSVYLPTYLKSAYALAPADAANRMAGFVVLAVIMRPIGGWLSDRIDPIPVLSTAFGVVVVTAPPGNHPGPDPDRNPRLPHHGRSPRCRLGSSLRPGRATRTRRQGGGRDRCRWRSRRSRRVRPAVAHGDVVRVARQLRLGAHRPRPRRGRRRCPDQHGRTTLGSCLGVGRPEMSLRQPEDPSQ
jgi:NNP family nitrate/nitrite transporter-like MFS transporter